MEFQHDKSWETLKSIYELKLSAKEAWNKFIEFHEQTNPKTYWKNLKNIDIETEQNEIKEWIEELIENNPLPKATVALWIGLLKLEDNEMEVPTIYLVGADTYDAEDIEWACEPTYLPENRYGQPALLKEIDEISKTDEEDNIYSSQKLKRGDSLYGKISLGINFPWSWVQAKKPTATDKTLEF